MSSKLISIATFGATAFLIAGCGGAVRVGAIPVAHQHNAQPTTTQPTNTQAQTQPQTQTQQNSGGLANDSNTANDTPPGQVRSAEVHERNEARKEAHDAKKADKKASKAKETSPDN